MRKGRKSGVIEGSHPNDVFDMIVQVVDVKLLNRVTFSASSYVNSLYSYEVSPKSTRAFLNKHVRGKVYIGSMYQSAYKSYDTEEKPVLFLLCGFNNRPKSGTGFFNIDLFRLCLQILNRHLTLCVSKEYRLYMRDTVKSAYLPLVKSAIHEELSSIRQRFTYDLTTY